MSDTQPHEGHRARLRERFLSGNAASLPDEALLELLLTYAIPQRDVRPLAQSLLARFGTLTAVLDAEPAALSQTTGVKDTSIVLLKLVHHLRQQTGPVPTSQPDPSPPVLIPSAAPAPAQTTQPPPIPLTVEAQVLGETRPVPERKLQVSNGYLLNTAQLARLLTFIHSKPTARKITTAELTEGSGLSSRQVENLVSMGSALGLITPRTQILTPFGGLVVHHDIFLDSPITLEFCHFLAAGNPRHLVWFEVFNDLLATQPPMVQPAWTAWLRQRLAGQYSRASLMKHVAHEVRFILDAYLVQNFKKLNLLNELPEKTFALRRYTALQPLSLAAMIYHLGRRSGARLVPFDDLSAQPGSLGRLFALDPGTLRQIIESVHKREWLRFEVRHGLDQLRLIEGLESLEFLAAAYENRAPQPRPPSEAPSATPMLL